MLELGWKRSEKCTGRGKDEVNETDEKEGRGAKAQEETDGESREMRCAK